MLFSKSSISDLLGNSQQMIDIASNDGFIKTALLEVNFDESKLNDLQLTWKTGDDKTKEYTKAVGEQKEKKILFENTFKESHAVYMKHVKFGKAVCRNDPERAAKYGVNEARKRRFNEWLLQATDFYVKLLADDPLVEKYGTLGLAREELEAGQQGIFAANTAKEDYKTAIGNTQAVKVERDLALLALDKAITDFAMVCQYALIDNPQHLEKMGIRVYSPGYKKAKKEEPDPAQEEGAPAREEPSADTQPQTEQP
jgi:hypothetical protein